MIDLIKIMMIIMTHHCIDNDTKYQKGGEATSCGGAGSEKVGGR